MGRFGIKHGAILGIKQLITVSEIEYEESTYTAFIDRLPIL